MKTKSFALLVFIILYASLVVSLDHGDRVEEERFLAEFVNHETGEVDKRMAELLWVGCKLDLKEIAKNFRFYGTDYQELSSSTENIHTLEQDLLDCIQKKNLGIVFPDTIDRRTNLLRRIASAPAPATSTGSPSPALSPVPAPDVQPAPVPAPSFLSPPSNEDPYFHDYAPPPLIDGSPMDHVPSPSIEPDNGKSHWRSIVIAVAVTAAATSIVASLLFFCCSRICRTGSGIRQNDERPLLSLSLSDYSFGNSFKEEKLGHQSFNDNLSPKKTVAFGENNKTNALHTSLDQHTVLVAVAKSENPNGLLPLPPGRVSSSGALQLPTEPLPPEPPASLRPVSGSPPAPPLPPSAPSKASGSAGLLPPGAKPGPPPPPPPKAGPSPPRPPPPIAGGPKAPRPPTGLNPPSNIDAAKPKLKPFFWDKVLANPDHSMVWNEIKSGSFQFNEEMIETLFGFTPVDKHNTDKKKESSSQDNTPQYIQILDPKKAQNLSILLRALNVTTEEVCDALREGNELPAEFIETLLKMAPTTEEELKLRLFTGELSLLGPAERFLKAIIDIPLAFKRMEALLFMCTLQEEVSTTKESFQVLEVACKELRNSRLFLKLLEAVLKTGNRMNDGTFRGGAQAFKLDTLLKLSDVKGIDGKTTLLHFVVQEIIRSEGVRASRVLRESQSSVSGISVKTDDLTEEVSPDTEENIKALGLQVVSRLSSEIENVKKAAVVDADNLTGTVAKLGNSLLKTREFLSNDMDNLGEDSGFHETLTSFVHNSEVDVTSLLQEEKRIMALVKSTGDYFHGNSGKDEGLRLFVVVRDFLIILDKVCKEVGEAQKKSAKSLKKEASTASAAASDHRQQQPAIDLHHRMFPAIAERREHDFSSSSDDET